ncbi:MAG: class I SAM-dependent methyltransferase [Candidatus Methanomethylophilaceae archaeon]|nr:class I SAM-dependent methyltransferase [Candidatus Methanomethylophilaceae archaeon]
MEQAERWNELYRSQRRTWRGVTDLGNLRFSAGSRILEIGCGNGKTLAALRDAGYSVTGIDFSSEAVKACRELLGDDAETICASVTDMPFEDGAFDGAVMFHVFENIDVPDVEKAVSELRRVLRPGAYVAVKVFSEDDMRSGKGESVSEDTVVRGNGIRYRYFTEAKLRDAFGDTECVSIRTVREDTRFGEVRSRIEAVFRF